MSDHRAAGNLHKGICWSNLSILLYEWHSLLSPIFERRVPTRTNHRRKLKPWKSSETSRKLKKLETLERKLKRKETEEFRVKLTSKQVALSKACEDDQTAYESNLANGRSSRSLFKYFKSLGKGSDIPESVHWGNNSATTKSSQANLFNAYFQSVFTINRDCAFNEEPASAP